MGTPTPPLLAQAVMDLQRSPQYQRLLGIVSQFCAGPGGAEA